ncbi:hypothetical protein V5799_016217 [Amblyomma americanum]|uniref:Sulfotransferase domain-containing protein n=1 Tax=Amblyomma americanum TaxID=6943 RepID=A0AAQ4F5N7_AMBAM
MLSSPNMEMMGADAVRKMPRPGALKTHIPLHSLKYSTRTKYIYIARNPHDCCVSFYYFINEFTPKDCKELPFDAFFDMFLAGDLLYIDYFDHLLSWYPHRNDPNVLFITYERLKKDTSYWVLRIADFLGEEYGSALRKNEALLNKVLDSCTIENMKTALSDSTNVWIQKALDLPLEKRISSLEVYRNDLSGKEEMPRGGGFVRKGIVGDWKNLFTPAQRPLYRASKRTEDTGSGLHIEGVSPAPCGLFLQFAARQKLQFIKPWTSRDTEMWRGCGCTSFSMKTLFAPPSHTSQDLTTSSL